VPLYGADRHGKAQLAAVREWQRLARDRAADAFGHHRGVGDAGMRQQRRELLAAGAREQVVRTQLLQAGPGQELQGLVADVVAVVVVDALEVVDVQHQQRQRIPDPARARQLALAEQVEMPAVEGAGQHVGMRLALHFLRMTRALGLGRDLLGPEQRRAPARRHQQKHDQRKGQLAAGLA